MNADRKAPAESSNGMRSLSRAIAVFEQIQRYNQPQRLSTIAADLGMSSPTTLRILRVLQEAGLVSQTDKSYRIGPAVLPAARVYLERDPLPRTAKPVLEKLSSNTGMTASLYARLGFERILVERVIGKSSLGYTLPQGRRLPLTAGAAGKILIAGLSPEEQEHAVGESIRLRYEPEGFSLAELRGRLPAEGEDFASSEDERATGVVSIAMALNSPDGPPVHAISLTAPIHAVSRETLVSHLPELRHATINLANLIQNAY